MKRDPWVLYCEAFRESFPGAGVKIELSPVALDAFYRKVMSAECVSPEGRTIPAAADLAKAIVDDMIEADSKGVPGTLGMPVMLGGDMCDPNEQKMRECVLATLNRLLPQGETG